MHPLSIKHSPTRNRLDFALYIAVVIALATYLIVASETGRERWLMAGVVLGGLALWSVLEYLLHRFVLHAVPPFREWHRQHHEQQSALIGAPTLLSASLIVVLVFLPAVWIAGIKSGCAMTLGVTLGYLGYSLTHHAIHQWRSDNRWLMRRKRWHAQHHIRFEHTGRFGVTSECWDRIFRTRIASGRLNHKGV